MLCPYNTGYACMSPCNKLSPLSSIVAVDWSEHYLLQSLWLLFQPCRSLAITSDSRRVTVDGIRPLQQHDQSFFPTLEHFCPLLVQIAQMGLILTRWGLILPRIPPSTRATPVLYSAVTNHHQPLFFTHHHQPLFFTQPSQVLN